MHFFYAPQNHHFYNVHKYMKFEDKNQLDSPSKACAVHWKHMTNTILQNDKQLYKFFTESVGAVKYTK